MPKFVPTSSQLLGRRSSIFSRSFLDSLAAIDKEGVLPGLKTSSYAGMLSPRALREREGKRAAWYEMRDLQRRGEWVSRSEKRDLSGRANGTIDPWYACFLALELRDYALNFSLPWSAFPFSFSFFLIKKLSFICSLCVGAAAPQTMDPVTNAYAPYNVRLFGKRTTS